MGNLFDEEEGYYKPVRVAKSNYYMEYGSSSDRNKTLSVEACRNKFMDIS